MLEILLGFFRPFVEGLKEKEVKKIKEKKAGKKKRGKKDSAHG